MKNFIESMKNGTATVFIKSKNCDLTEDELKTIIFNCLLNMDKSQTTFVAEMLEL